MLRVSGAKSKEELSPERDGIEITDSPARNGCRNATVSGNVLLLTLSPGSPPIGPCHKSVMTFEYKVKSALFLLDLYRRELAVFLHQVDEAFYFLILQKQYRLPARSHAHLRMCTWSCRAVVCRRTDRGGSRAGHGYFLTVEVLSALFRRLFLEMLVAAHHAGRLQFPSLTTSFVSLLR
jgi:hypothetical protein